MNNKKLFISALSLLLICAIAATLVIMTADKEPIINIVKPLFSIDISDPKQVVGFGEYVFIAYINKQVETYYNTEETGGEPMTKYSVSVLDNLKGVLVKDTEILFSKSGGITKDGKYFYKSSEDEVFPEQGGVYIIAATATQEGELVAYTPTAVVPLNIVFDDASALKNENLIEQFEKSETVKLYKESIKNEVIFPRERYISKYDGSGKKIDIGIPYTLYVHPETTVGFTDDTPNASEKK